MNRGRPKSKIGTANKDARKFFETCDKLSLSLKDLHALLRDKLGQQAPSYRTLQEWRRGTRLPRFVAFKNWTDLLQKE